VPAALYAIAPTPFITVQDGGRRGWRRFGVAVSGAMDRMSLAIANALVGNRLTEAALEFAHAGGEWRIDAPSCRIAVAGGSFGVLVDGVPVAPFRSITLRQGQRLHVRGAPDAVWGYLAVAGGFDIALQFGSRSTHSRTGIGGWLGRALSAGDALPLRLAQAPGEPDRVADPPGREAAPFRLVLGPQDDYFTEPSLTTLLKADFTVTHHMDRMAYRLDGPLLEHRDGYNIITDGVVPGSISVPGTGLPLVLMRDAPTVGGYPKIATVIESDLGRLAQQRPGTVVSFQAVTAMEAQALRRRFLARL
jgi:5-oxoprolinase (ATP-hydrolysing) subunit C